MLKYIFVFFYEEKTKHINEKIPDFLLPVYADTMKWHNDSNQKSWHLSHAFHQHLKSCLMPFLLI